MTQLSRKVVMKRWKRKGQVAAKYEMKKLHFRSTSNPNQYKELNKDQKDIILESHMFLK